MSFSPAISTENRYTLCLVGFLQGRLRTWIKQEQSGELKASLGASKLTADQLRIRELERELSVAKTERDILMALGHPEKATAFFAKESK